jgi:putative ABC transport system permease protein
MVDRLVSDVVSALRSLRAAPAIPLAAVVTAALAVAMNLAMAGLIDRALLSPPDFVVDPHQVFTVGFEVSSPSREKGVTSTASYLTFEAVRDQVTGVTVAAWHYASTSIGVGDSRVAVKANGVTGAYFDMLGARAAIGRTLLPGDDRPPVGTPVAVLSHSLWRSAFGADPQAVGRQLRYGGLSLEIVGVMPPGFSGHTAERVDLWLPLSTAMHDSPGWHRAATLAVVELGVRIARGDSANAASSQLAAAAGTPVILAPLIGADFAPDSYRIAMWLTAVSLVVLAAGLANGATLFLVRGARRRRENSIRAAMGATRGRLLRQLLVESAIVAIGATGVALLLGFWFDELVRRVLFPTLVERAGVNAMVIVAALIGGASTLVVGVVAGALQLPAAVSSEDLAGRPRIWRRSSIQRELLIVQTTLSVVLITGAGMFAQSYRKMAGDDHRSQLVDVLLVTFDDGPGSVRDQDQLLTDAIDRLRKVAGVESTTTFAALPVGGAIHRPPISVPGVGEPRLDGTPPSLIELTPESFDILRIEVVQGRRFTADDDRGAPVVIVNETMARAVWPGTTAIGKCLRIGFSPIDRGISKGPPGPPATAPCREVVGIARDWRRPSSRGRGERRQMFYYVPFSQALSLPPWMLQGPRAEGLLVKQADVAASPEQIRLAVTGGRTDLPFVDVRSYASLNGPRRSHWLIGTQLLLIFGALALATAALGLSAAFAHAVAERRQEIAVRLAVGASRQRVLLMMLCEGTTIAGRGAINGVVVATLVGWAARSIIVDLSSPGLLVIAAAMLIVVIVAAVATWLPARTASRTEPCELLRQP